jgi:hypothetical protein
MYEEWSDYFYKKLYNKYGINIKNYLYSNKNISLKYIEKELSKGIDYDFLIINPNIDIESVILYYKENDLYLFIHNNNLLYKYIDLFETYDYIKYMEKTYKHKINYKYLSANSNITWDFIKNNIDKDWNYNYMVRHNKNITLDIVLNNPNLFKNISSKDLSTIKSINWIDILNNPDINWNYNILSKNDNITFDIVLNNLDKKWCFSNLSMNRNITYDIIRNNPQFDWSIEKYLLNPNLRLNDLDFIDIHKNSKKFEIMMQNIAINNYDNDRNEYFIKNNIIIDNKIYKILNKDNVERFNGLYI